MFTSLGVWVKAHSLVAIEGDGLEKPDEIVVTWFTDAAARDAFENDPEFKAVAEIRDRAVDLVTITARSVFGD